MSSTEASFNQEEKHSNPFQASYLYENASWETSIKQEEKGHKKEGKRKKWKNKEDK